MPNRRMKLEDVEFIQDMLRRKRSYEAIAKATGFSAHTIMRMHSVMRKNAPEQWITPKGRISRPVAKEWSYNSKR